MNRREFIRSAATVSAAVVSGGLSASTKKQGRAVCGKVVKGGENGGPAAGVTVTDGLACVRTDENGEFRIPYRKEARFVSVTIPSGYRCDDFYSPISANIASHYFYLSPWKASAGKGCSFVHIADSEVGGVHETGWTDSIKRLGEEENAAFIVHTGDICRYRGMRAHLLTMNAHTMGRPVIYCLGNHDMAPGPAGETSFENLFGPCWRSFDAGGVHFVVTPMPMGDHRPSYTMDEVADWVRNDLAMLPKGMPVVFFNHMLTNYNEGGEICGFTIGQKRRLDISKACNFTGFVYGHLHVNHFQRHGKTSFICSAPPQMGGIALHPATLRTIRADENGILGSDIRYGAVDRPKISGAGAKWTAALPGKVLFCSPLVEDGCVFVGTSDDEGCGNAAVTAIDAESGRTLWSRPMANSIHSKMVYAGGLVIAQDVEGRVAAMRAGDGEVVWRHELPAHPWKLQLNALVFDRESGMVIAGNGDSMTALEAASGRVVWSGTGVAGRREPCVDAPAIGGGRIVSSGNWDGMYCCDLKSGKGLWSVVDPVRRFPGATPLVVDGRIYALAAKSFLEIDLESGRTLREKRLPGSVQVTTKVLPTEKHFIFGTAKCGLTALDRETLSVAWTGAVQPATAPFSPYSKLPQRCVGTAPVLLPDGTVCASANDGAIHFWRESDGRHLREFRTGAPYFADVTYGDGRIYAADAAGFARMFEV